MVQISDRQWDSEQWLLHLSQREIHTCPTCGYKNEENLVPLTFGPSHDIVLGKTGCPILVPESKLKEAQQEFFDRNFTPIS